MFSQHILLLFFALKVHIMYIYDIYITLKQYLSPGQCMIILKCVSNFVLTLFGTLRLRYNTTILLYLW